MFDCEGGGVADVGFFRDTGTEMPADPDNPGAHYGEAPLFHLGTTFTLGAPLGRVEYRACRAAAAQGFVAFDTFMLNSSAAGWYTGRVLSERDMLYRSARDRE